MIDTTGPIHVLTQQLKTKLAEDLVHVNMIQVNSLENATLVFDAVAKIENIVATDACFCEQVNDNNSYASACS